MNVVLSYLNFTTKKNARIFNIYIYTENYFRVLARGCNLFPFSQVCASATLLFLTLVGSSHCFCVKKSSKDVIFLGSFVKIYRLFQILNWATHRL